MRLWSSPVGIAGARTTAILSLPRLDGLPRNVGGKH